jgi:hypothetical protein
VEEVKYIFQPEAHEQQRKDEEASQDQATWI